MLGSSEVHVFQRVEGKRVPVKMKAGTYDVRISVNEDGKLVGASVGLSVLSSVTGAIPMEVIENPE